MALKEHGRVKRLAASGGGSLEAPNHESFRVRGIHCVPSAADTFLEVVIEGVTVGKFRVAGKSGNHLPYPAALTAQIYESTTGGLFLACTLRGCPLDFPLAAGQTLTVSRAAEAGDVALVYDAYDAGDVAAEEPNGSNARIRRYLHYMQNEAAITESPGALDESLLWTGMQQWPVGGRQVPHNAVIRLLAILGCPCAEGTGAANEGYTTYLKLLREGDVLFDVDQNGLPFLGDVAAVADAVAYSPVGSVVGPFTAEYPYPPLWLDPPMEFTPGETLTPQVVIAGLAGSGIAAAGLDVAMLLERELAG